MRIRLCLLVCAAVVASLLPIGTAHAAPQRWAVCGEWRQVRLPETYGFPDDLAVVSPTEAWLAAYVGEVAGFPAVLHWTGIRWETVSFPVRPGAVDEEVNAFAVVSSDDVYAVGFVRGRYETHPMVAHWDGSSWSLVRIGRPHLGGALEAAAIGADGSIVAVGAGTKTLVLRFDGSRWARVASPHPGRFSRFNDLVRIGGTTWAVGSYEDIRGKTRTLAARLSNGSWRTFLGARGSLEAVDATRPHLVWAVGPNKDVAPQRGVIMRWDGTSWTTVRRLQKGTALQDIVAASPNDAWAVGYRGGMYDHPRPLLLRRHGAPWQWATPPDVRGRFWTIDGTPHNLWTLWWRYRANSDGPPLLGTFHRC